ncbi:hypothetical protein M3Y94_00445100 [Aphelenchoides besseyi]|nr:hypothetical protein M3Y94_00445100 [Aphelenchoides besseyi]KAI6229359.1 hypothetical protein M3Y95_00522900 [Aphelenchoides besseyi]
MFGISCSTIFELLQNSILVLLAFVLCVHSTTAAPAPFVYDVGNEDLAPSSDTVYRLFYVNPIVRNYPVRRDKKYDRNCFFSPVQCMLSYDNTNNDIVYHPRRK